MPHLCGSMRPWKVFGAACFKAEPSTWSALFLSISWLHPCSHGDAVSCERRGWPRAQHMPLAAYSRASEEQAPPPLAGVALMQV